MNSEELERALESIGKRCFENCYPIAKKKGDQLTKKDLIKYDPKLQGTSEKALSTRLSKIIKIFREGKAEIALETAKNRKR